jgi:hypothetical protein
MEYTFQLFGQRTADPSSSSLPRRPRLAEPMPSCLTKRTPTLAWYRCFWACLIRQCRKCFSVEFSAKRRYVKLRQHSGHNIGRELCIINE